MADAPHAFKAAESYLAASLNLSDVASAATARDSLGATSGDWTDDLLTSPNNALPRLLFSSDTLVLHDQTAATLALVKGGYAVANPAIVTSGATVLGTLPILRFNPASYTVGGKTLTLLLTSQVSANATAPGINFTFGLYPVTVAGVADTLTFTLGTVVSGATVVMNTPSASTITTGATTGITPPSAGQFALGCVTSGTLANNSAVQLSAQVYFSHV